MKPLAQRITKIKPSPTLAISAKADAMKSQGIDVIGFGAGEPDFDTPDNIKNAAVKAIQTGKTKYTAVGGTVELKQAIIQKLKNDNQLVYEPAQIIVSCGAKHSLYNIAQVLFETGDEVIIPAPYWVSYPDQVILNEAKPVVVLATDKNHFKITPEQLQASITPKTKALILNSPSNPTGAAYTKSELEKLAEICLKNDVYIISDEIYEKIVFDGFEHFSVASLSKEIQDITLLVNGVSKGYAMTGWRMGYTAGPKSIIQAMTTLQGQSTSNISSITQAACVEALNGSQESVKQMLVSFQERRDVIVKGLNQISGIHCQNPQGAFYVFPNIKELLGRRTKKGKVLNTAADFCDYLLEDFLVAVVAGEGFGANDYMRLSYATSMANINKGLERMAQAVAELV